MPKAVPWTVVHREKSQAVFDTFINDSKSVVFAKNNTTKCTVCASTGDSHSMSYQLAVCASTTCAELAIYVKCNWRAKVVTCKVTDLISIYQLGSHVSLLAFPRNNKLTRPQRTLVKYMIDRDLKPARIRDDLIETLNLDASKIPRLSDVQNCVANYRRSHKSNSDLLEMLAELASKYTKSAATKEEDTIAFGFELDDFGGPFIGEGADDDPSVFGLSTMALMRRLDADPESVAMHIDATFKLNQSSFPVFVIGVSGIDLVPFRGVLYRLSTHRGHHRAHATEPSRAFPATTQRDIRVKYIMGDADHAQYNAVQAVFGRDVDVIYLMCFYHVIAKVVERSKGMTRTVRKSVFQQVYNLHFARSQEELEAALESAWGAWASTADTVKFGQYFYKQWLQGKFMRWQCYHTPSGSPKPTTPWNSSTKY